MRGQQMSMFGASTLSVPPTGTGMRYLRFDAAAGGCEVDLHNPGSVILLPEGLQRIARNIIEHEGKHFSYVVRSAMHKEIRRGDVLRSLRWARVFAQLLGPSRVKQYVKGILFEETRNVALMENWAQISGWNYLEMVAALATSPKKWELPNRVSVSDAYFRGFTAALDNVGSFSLEGALQDLVRPSSKLWESYWGLRFQSVPLTQLQETFEHCDFPNLQFGRWAHRLLDTRWSALPGLATHSPIAMTEIVSGGWSEDAVRYSPDSSSSDSGEVLVIPPLPPYVYDNHTRPGFAQLRKHLPRVRFNEKLPGGIDLRWSGLLRGVCWRTYAFDQFGADYVSAKWEAVKVPEELWSHVNAVDAWCYAKLYNSAGMPVPQVPGCASSGDDF